jgi:hypothetical protein
MDYGVKIVEAFVRLPNPIKRMVDLSAMCVGDDHTKSIKIAQYAETKKENMKKIKKKSTKKPIKQIVIKPASKIKINEPNLEFFNRLNGFLHIKLDKAAKPWKGSSLMNVFAEPDARIKEISMDWETWDDEYNAAGDLTPDEWKLPVITAPEIRMAGAARTIVVHKSPKSGVFTVRDLANAVEKTEQATRGNTDWFGGIDCHHIYFEGIHQEKGVWHMYWGS